MFKTAITNYFLYIKKLIKCFFILLLSIFIFYLIFQLAIYLPFKDMDLDNYALFVEEIQDYIATIDIDLIFETGFITDILKDLYVMLNLEELKFTTSTILIVISLLVVLGAYQFSKWDCKRTMKKDFKNKDTVNNLIQGICRGIVSLIFSGLFLIITLYWLWAIFILPFIYAFFQAFKSLISTWFIYFRKYKMNNIVNFKNALRLVVVNAILLYLHSALLIYLLPYVSLYLILLLALTFLVYTSAVTEFTATAYFIDKRANQELEK